MSVLEIVAEDVAMFMAEMEWPELGRVGRASDGKFVFANDGKQKCHIVIDDVKVTLCMMKQGDLKATRFRQEKLASGITVHKWIAIEFMAFCVN